MADSLVGFILTVMSMTADVSRKPATPHARKWLLGAGFAAVLLALLAVIAARWIPSDEQLARRAAAELAAPLDMPVSIGALHRQLLSSPRVELDSARAVTSVSTSSATGGSLAMSAARTCTPA